MIIKNAIKSISEISEDKDILFNLTYVHEPSEYNDEDFGKRTYSIILKGAKDKYNVDAFSDLCFDIKNKVESLTEVRFIDHYERHDFDADGLVYVKGYNSFDLKRKSLELDNWKVWKSQFKNKTGLKMVDLETEEMDMIIVAEILHGKKEHAVQHLERSQVPKKEAKSISI